MHGTGEDAANAAPEPNTGQGMRTMRITHTPNLDMSDDALSMLYTLSGQLARLQEALHMDSEPAWQVNTECEFEMRARRDDPDQLAIREMLEFRAGHAERVMAEVS